MNDLLHLALAQPKPVRLITGEEPIPFAWPEWLTWTLLGAAGVVALTWLVVRVLQRYEQHAAEDIAFRRLSRRAGNRADRPLLLALAGASGHSPLALWLSDHALAVSVEAFVRTAPDAATLARVGALCERRGIPKAPRPKPFAPANSAPRPPRKRV